MHARISPAVAHSGFMFLELLIVLGILGIVSVITIVAINPQKHFCETANARRHIHTRELGNAVSQYEISTHTKAGGDDVPSGETNIIAICRAGVIDATCVNLDVLVPEFLLAMPQDEDETDPRYSGYGIYRIGQGMDMVQSLRVRDCTVL